MGCFVGVGGTTSTQTITPNLEGVQGDPGGDAQPTHFAEISWGKNSVYKASKRIKVQNQLMNVAWLQRLMRRIRSLTLWRFSSMTW